MMTLPLSGQPSSSSKPLNVSGSFGHLSLTSGMPSLSLSGSGQPSSSSKPARSSGSSGHLSFESRIPSPSRSPSPPSGQPSSSWSPSRSSGTLGQRSSTSGMPSLSLSGSGQPSSSLKPSKSSGSSGHWSTSSLMPSPSRSPIDGSKMKPRNTRWSAASNPPVYRTPPPSLRYEFRSVKSLMPPTTSLLALTPVLASLARRYVA